MRISGFTTIRPNMADTRTYEDFMKFLSVLNAQVKSCELLEPLRHTLTNWGNQQGSYNLNDYRTFND